jgi:PAS domain S-box-containing protein
MSVRAVRLNKPDSEYKSLSLEMLKSICDALPALVGVYNINSGEYLYVNNAINKLLGYSPEEFIKGGISFISSLVHPEDIMRIMQQNEAALKRANAMQQFSSISEPIVTFEYRMKHKNGRYIWLRTDGSVLNRKNGKVEHVLNTSLDITSHKLAMNKLSKAKASKIVEDKLRASEERYQAFIQNSREGIWRVELEKPIPITLPADKQIRLMYKYAYLAEANLAMAHMYGLSSIDQLIGLRLNDLLVESDPNNTAYLKAFIKSGYNLSNTESHEIDSSGNNKYFSNSLVGIIEDGYVVRAWGTQLDVTDQHVSNELLKKSEERLARALHASKIGMWEWDMVSNELRWSDRQKKIFGMKKSEAVNYELYISKVHPDYRKALTEIFNNSQKTGKSYQIEHRVKWPDGTYHWLLGQGQAILRDGKPVRMVGTSMIIDERKKSEELAINNERLLAERTLLLELNKTKDEFISIASHQLRTPATGVKQYLGMLLQGHSGKLQLTKQQLEMLKIAYECNERQIHIVNDLLRTAQVDSGKFDLKKRRTDIVRLVKNTIKEMSSTVGIKKQQFRFASQKKNILVTMDPDRMQMVIENILDNASKYSYEGKEIKVSIKLTPNNVLVHISDKGVGISKDDQKKLFQKFSRIQNPLSNNADGNGLGLYWVKKIISQHGGRIKVKSEVNNGSTFTIILPV